MSIYKDHLNEMKKKIQLLGEERTRIVSLINCERQLFAYEKDVLPFDWNDQDFFRHLLDSVWVDLPGGDKCSFNLDLINKYVEHDYADTNTALYFFDSIDALSKIFKNESMAENSVKFAQWVCVLSMLWHMIFLISNHLRVVI